MKPQGAAKHLILAFFLALLGYAIFYQAIEHRRTRKGPWQVTFTRGSNGAPTIIINQPKLGITNFQISFPASNATGALAPGHAPSDLSSTNGLPPHILSFARPQLVPFEVPFGQCVFMDTTFQPGTVTFALFGHEIELLPRTLVIDRREHPWRSGGYIALEAHP